MTIEKQIDELTKHRFDFWVNGNLIILSTYFLLSRENTRKRNYNIVKRYDRLSDRDSSITLEEVPFTQEIKQEALQKYIETLKVCTWNEYRNKY